MAKSACSTNAMTTSSSPSPAFRSRGLWRPRMRSECWLAGVFLSLGLLPLGLLSAAGAAEPDRSPVDLVLGPGDAWLVTANETAGTVSLVRTADGKVLDEQCVGDHPIGIALAPDGQTLLVSCHYSGEVAVIAVQGEKLAPKGTIDVGYPPHGIAIAPDASTA